MNIYSSLCVGDYFLFLIGADNLNPVLLYFREHEEELRGRGGTGNWKEKVYLYPAIIQKKWLEFKYRDRFIPSGKFDNVLPLELSYPTLNRAAVPLEVVLRSSDKDYRGLNVMLTDTSSAVQWEKAVRHVRHGREYKFSLSVRKPGVYTFRVCADDISYTKTSIFFLPDGAGSSEDTPIGDFPYGEETATAEIYCVRCGSRIYPLQKSASSGYEYKNYIPFKEYLDTERLGPSSVAEFITSLPHSQEYKRGFVHLLNMLRLATVDDEVTIIKNLFKDDPEFAYFITTRLFLFQMIPLMKDRVLQRILNGTDDETIAECLKGESKTLVCKILANISKRRAKSIEAMCREPKWRNNDSVKEQMQRAIRTHFEERFGRVLKIPESTRPRYNVTGFAGPPVHGYDWHGGDLLVRRGKELFIHRKPSPGGSFHSTSSTPGPCARYDLESSSDRLFSVSAVTESAVLLKCEAKLKTAMIHTYDWATNIERGEIFEDLTEHTILPLARLSDAVVLTIGAIDRQNRGREQVVRLKVH